MALYFYRKHILEKDYAEDIGSQNMTFLEDIVKELGSDIGRAILVVKIVTTQNYVFPIRSLCEPWRLSLHDMNKDLESPFFPTPYVRSQYPGYVNGEKKEVLFLKVFDSPSAQFEEIDEVWFLFVDRPAVKTSR